MQDLNMVGRLASTVTWEVREGQVDTAMTIIARFLPLAREEPGMELLTVQQDNADPGKFLFYEIYANAAVFEAHQQTPHFRTMILEQAIPLLKHRERRMFTTL
jgi:quinol monooxygenase YgiN